MIRIINAKSKNYLKKLKFFLDKRRSGKRIDTEIVSTILKDIKKIPSGALSCIYLLTYSFGRLWIEGFRTDPLCLGGLPPYCEGGIRMAQLMSIILIGISGISLWWIYRYKRKSNNLRGLKESSQ